MSTTSQVKCPQCGLLTFYNSENQFRPFCSQRCQTIDLGNWASEKHRIASQEPLSEHDLESLLSETEKNLKK